MGMLSEKCTKKELATKPPGKYTIVDTAGKVIKVVTKTGNEGAEQTHKKQCDINQILKDYARTGMIRHAKKYQGQYDDVTVDDFQDAMFLVTRAQNMFNELPSGLRERFEGNPGRFLEFAQNPANRDEMIQLGMLRGNDGWNSAGEPSGAPTPANAPTTPPATENPPG